jgi:hypothetical protein
VTGGGLFGDVATPSHETAIAVEKEREARADAPDEATLAALLAKIINTMADIEVRMQALEADRAEVRRSDATGIFGLDQENISCSTKTSCSPVSAPWSSGSKPSTPELILCSR